MAAALETPNDYLRRKGIPLQPAPGVSHDREAFIVAAGRLMRPQELTAADVQQLALIDAELGTLAHAKMLGYDGDVQALTAQFGDTPLSAVVFFKLMELQVRPMFLLQKFKQQRTTDALAQQAREIATLTRALRELQSYVQALEAQLHAAEPVA